MDIGLWGDIRLEADDAQKEGSEMGVVKEEVAQGVSAEEDTEENAEEEVVDEDAEENAEEEVADEDAEEEVADEEVADEDAEAVQGVSAEESKTLEEDTPDPIGGMKKISKKPAKTPTAKISKKPTAKISKKPTAKPAKTPTAKPAKKSTAKPAKKSTAKISKKPSAKPARKPMVKTARRHLVEQVQSVEPQGDVSYLTTALEGAQSCLKWIISLSSCESRPSSSPSSGPVASAGGGSGGNSSAKKAPVGCVFLGESMMEYLTDIVGLTDEQILEIVNQGRVFRGSRPLSKGEPLCDPVYFGTVDKSHLTTQMGLSNSQIFAIVENSKRLKHLQSTGKEYDHLIQLTRSATILMKRGKIQELKDMAKKLQSEADCARISKKDAEVVEWRKLKMVTVQSILSQAMKAHSK